MSVHILVVIFLLPGCFSLKVTSNTRYLLPPRVPPNPCPDVFGYATNDDGIVFGVLRLKGRPSEENELIIEVKFTFSVDAQAEDYFITPVLNKKEFINAIKEKKNLDFFVNFYYGNHLPYVKSIKANEELQCMGPSVSGNFVNTITLKYYIKSKFETPSFKGFDLESFFKRINNTRKEPESGPSSMLCGVRGPILHPMVRGSDTTRGEWPWLVALFWKISIYNNKEFKCGAFLISKNHVITAEHCVHNGRIAISKEQILLKIGAYDINEDNEDFATYKTPTSIVLSPNYYPDLAILTISDVNYNRYIKPVCLWKSYDHEELYQSFKYGTVIGWSRDEYGNSYTPLPKSIKVPIVPLTYCQKIFVTDITNKFCTGIRNVFGACDGEMRGFYLEIDNRWYLRGIVFTGEEYGRICKLREYVVYTDLAKYHSWINSQL